MAEPEQQGWWSWVWGWAHSVLVSLHLVNIHAKMLILGLDNAGKTTLLGTLSQGRLKSCKPTIRPNCEELSLGSVLFTAHDLGGNESARTLWREYLVDVDVLVYLVDATDAERFEEAHTELNALLKSDALAEVPVLVLGNKIDLREAVSETELRERMGLPAHITTGKGPTRTPGDRPIEVFMCSVVNRSGYSEGFRWVSSYLK